VREFVIYLLVAVPLAILLAWRLWREGDRP
jgi:hypothetical protein